MKLLVKMTDSEYKAFRKYTSKGMGFNSDTRRTFSSDFRDQEAEDWLLRTGKIRLVKRPTDSRGRVYTDAYLVIHGSEDYCMDIYQNLYTMEVYDETISRKGRTILRNPNLKDRLIREF